MGDEWMRTEDVARELDVSKTVVWRQIQAGRLPAEKFGRDWRIKREDFERFRTIKRTRGRPRKSEPSPYRYSETGEHATAHLAADRHPPAP